MNYDQIISQRIQNIKPSGIRKFFDILEEMTDAISLGIGEPDFVTPWHIRDAGIYSLERGHTKYTSNAGMLELRREISNYLRRRFDLNYGYAKQILVTVGGSEAIDLALRCLLNPGDEVIVPVPSFVCYGPLTEMAGGVPVYVELKAEDQFRLTPEQLKAAITPKTKVLVLPFPSNPTGGNGPIGLLLGEHGAGTHQHVGHFGHNAADSLLRGGGAEGDLGGRQAALYQSLGQGHGLLRVVNGDDGDDANFKYLF